ncbi:DNA-binding protein D-ETS-4 [Harmonia axyridis]|uniref:DNA-binding protein D-ETS-4 n=1 Tax=Harmonia axyridis TaxID=115357 RepID=UPI001E27694E|nr:DNA-binding protein D-ETS-4 [Harmonia axyridis]
MVILTKNTEPEETMPQIVPSAGFTPPCDYSTFADNFDLSLLPGGDQPLSPSTLLYAQSPPSGDPKKQSEFKVYTTFHHGEQDPNEEANFRPDFNKLLESDSDSSSSNLAQSPVSNIYLEVPSNSFQPNSPNSVGSLSPYSSQSLLSPNDHFGSYRQSFEANFYPSSPEQSLYAPSPSSVYSKSPRDEYLLNHYIKTESLSPIPPFSTFTIKEESFHNSCGFSSPSSPANSCHSGNTSLTKTETSDVNGLLETPFLNKQIKQEESTVDFSTLLNNFPDNSVLKNFLDDTFNHKFKESPPPEEEPKDHKLLREALRDTSYQKKYNTRPIDLDLLESYIKMEEDEKSPQDQLNEQLARENIEPVLNIAIEQMRKEVDKTCATLGISTDPSHWNASNVFSWIQWTSREFNLPEPSPDQWNISGVDLLELSEEAFLHRSNQGGMILHAQLEIWKAAHSSDDLSMSWLPDTASSNASSGDISEDEDEETSITSDPSKPSTSRTGTHIHLWQFLKELLQNPQTHGSCIRWLDRAKGIFKIEDSVKVARLWGRRKNRPAMNYDKLSRSIRQYYKKGIMKKTERSQRLVYQFCHPYNS